MTISDTAKQPEPLGYLGNPLPAGLIGDPPDVDDMTAEAILADPDRILELYDCCPKCGSTALEALTWKSIGSDDITVGCWSCDWMLHPPGWTPPNEPNTEYATPVRISQ